VCGKETLTLFYYVLSRVHIKLKGKLMDPIDIPVPLVFLIVVVLVLGISACRSGSCRIHIRKKYRDKTFEERKKDEAT